jgi:hypothetical protein
MKLRRPDLAMCALAAALAGCTSNEHGLAPADVTAISATSSIMCQEPNPAYCGAADGTIHDGSGIGSNPVVPGDPSPGVPGLWLGNTVSGNYCGANYNPLIQDADADWLDDTCEYELAKAFAPTLYMASLDGCDGGEPYWAAKYFPNAEPGNWDELVRIAYMPAYYSDCGFHGHGGDSEFIMLGVKFNRLSRHWELVEAFLSSHEGTFVDAIEWHSDWHTGNDLHYPATSPRAGFPEVWIAKAKHANYRTKGLCDDGGLTFDTCADNIARGRIRVYGSRNVGSPLLDRFPVPYGARSTNPHNAPLDEVAEFFYTRANFMGWQHGVAGVTPYSDFLRNSSFECQGFIFACLGDIPSGTHPAVTTMSGDITDGPSSVSTYANATWNTFVTGGARPYHAEWYRQFTGQTGWTFMGASAGGSQTYSAGSYTMFVTSCTPFLLYARLFDANNQPLWNTHPVSVTMASCPSQPWLSSEISRSGDWYTAVGIGGHSPYSYSWEWMGTTCGGGGGENLTAALMSTVPASGATRRRPRQADEPGSNPNVISCGWQWFSSAQSVYWLESQRTLRVTVTDAQGAQSVSTYYVP